MRQILFSIVLALAPIALTAQSISMMVQARDTLTIAETQYRITYHTRTVRDTTATPYVYHDDEMRLDISQNGVSKFYSQSVELREAFVRKKLAANDYDLSGMPQAGSISWQFFRNYPNQGKSLLTDAVGGQEYQIEENQDTPEWTLQPDSTRDIMGYQCQLATTSFKGRKWNAWYTDDIPLDFGPWKLCGLPGLILSAYDSERQFIFEGIGLEQVDAPVTFVKTTREKVSMKDFRKLEANWDPMEQLKQFSGTGAQVVIMDGSGNKLDRISKPKTNNIER